MVTEPLLGLVMIVKDEAHGIVDTLRSFAPVIDHWSILDTGSTDGTQKLIRQTLADIPGTLYEEPFVDFATSRNRILDLHGTTTTFAIMADSDDRLHAPLALHEFCASQRSAATPAYLLQRRGAVDYYLSLVTRTSAAPRYTGRVHECINFASSARAPQAYLTQEAKPQSLEASRARWHRDLKLLNDEVKSDPSNPRARFYLAQTYECLGMPDNALVEYERRIDLGGWAEEVYEAKFRRARIMDNTKRPWPEVESAYLEAHRFAPGRAEPLFQIALHYYGIEAHALTYLFASRAMTLSKPDSPLFIDAAVYEWKAADLVAISAYYLGKQLDDSSVLAMGRRAAKQAQAFHPSDARLNANLTFYVTT
jgi:glycosyltransferase involved in cell wall biosynthesis